MGRGRLMRLWRLSGAQHAEAFDGGYGLFFDGRWNTVGHAVTYCSTSPSLSVLEQLVHIEDPALLPRLILVRYDVPDAFVLDTIGLEDLPSEWRRQDAWTQQRGDERLRSRSNPFLYVPSAIVSLHDSPNVNILINHNHPDSVDIRIKQLEPFAFDPQLFSERAQPSQRSEFTSRHRLRLCEGK